MASPFRRFPSFYGRDPEGSLYPFIGTLENRQFHRLDIGHNAHLIADDFWEAPAAGGPVSGSLSTTFDAMTVVGTGTVANSGISGSLSITFDAMTVTGVGKAYVAATGAITFSPMTVVATATALAKATGSATFSPMSVSGAAKAIASGSLSTTFSEMSVSSSASALIRASATMTFDPMVVAGTSTGGGGGQGGKVAYNLVMPKRKNRYSPNPSGGHRNSGL